MQIEFIFIGKNTDNYLSEGIEIYKKRIAHYLPLKFVVITPSEEKTITRAIKEESEKIFKKISSPDFVIALDEKGKAFSSVAFAGELQKIMNRSFSKIVFIIGSAYGLDESVKKRANLLLSFSQFTLTHQMIRLFLMEQTYRAMTILQGEKYHH